MKPINTDFATWTIARRVQKTSGITWLLLLVGVVIWIAIGTRAISLVHQKNALSSTLNQIEQKTKKYAERRAKEAQTPDKFIISDSQVNSINGAITQLNIPWGGIFSSIEAVTPKDIALISLEPEARKGFLKGKAEAKNSRAMIDYISALKEKSFFENVVITKHEVYEQDPNRPIRFQFTAHWGHGSK